MLLNGLQQQHCQAHHRSGIDYGMRHPACTDIVSEDVDSLHYGLLIQMISAALPMSVAVVVHPKANAMLSIAAI